MHRIAGRLSSQDELRWAAARVVAQQDIDAYMRAVGPELAKQRDALIVLTAEFAGRFPGDSDPALIRSCMRRQMRRVGYYLQRVEERAGAGEPILEVGSPATAPVVAEGDPP